MARGRQVLTRMFPDSPHVKHFKHYNEEYVEAVRELLALASSNVIVRQPSVVVKLTLGEGAADLKTLKGLPTALQADPLIEPLQPLKAVSEVAAALPDLAMPFLLGFSATEGSESAIEWSSADLHEVEELVYAACMV
jgi:Eukaryotic protein of unknown function (DUF829)